ncbi:hypothetical protein [Teichococcus oryzae]|uniref:Uncharacterized protein n=1 Tax=Teichococcus oryzae TaxID=1608942 RepID=A0A5B2THL6_9PROT|nr:hypothetical protein [Pseudoroseomonas oryzae]KAA2213986.1 hypothetical protein F0Q34_08065 [Pseudoroseomonas oryzae]
MLKRLILLAGLFLAAPVHAIPAIPFPMAAVGAVPAAAPPLAAPLAPPAHEACRQGRDTAALGWRLIDYGIATLKYGVGLVLILLGAMLVGIGAVVSLVEALFC